MSDWSFKKFITQHIAKPRIGDQRQPTLWPSEASALTTNSKGEVKTLGKCRRAIFFRYLKECHQFYEGKYPQWDSLVGIIGAEATEVNEYMRWIWRAGELYEEHVIRLSQEAGVFVGTQIPLYIKSHNISGKIDLRIISPVTHKYSNIEVKSVYGHNSDAVCGRQASARRAAVPGVPRDSNLMQIAIYHWWHASHDDSYEESRLVYGARDKGTYSEFLIKTVENSSNGDIEIWYKQIVDITTDWIKSDITINSILRQYKYVQACIDAGVIPDRDFDLVYTSEQIDRMYQDGELGKTDSEAYEKIVAREKENIERIAEDKKPLKPLMPIVKGDWQCRYCQYKNICYTDGNPKVL
jgi:hypothetical protein